MKGRRLFVEGLMGLAGLILLLGAVLFGEAWFDRHFLPVYFLPRRLYVMGELWARLALGLLGLLVLLLRPAAGRAAARATLQGLVIGLVSVLIALVFAVEACEVGLRLAFPRAAEEAPSGVEPLRQLDARLGWAFVPSHVGRVQVGEREIEYAFDNHGYRAPGPNLPVDYARPSVVFAGESIVTGFGLSWAQSIPALVGQGLGLQSANLSVFAYADDQVLMRLRQELPRFAQPQAVVVLFSPGLTFRDDDVERPHLDDALQWRPGEHPMRLVSLLRFFVPYHSTGDMNRLIARVRAELQEDVSLARARGAKALIVVPHYGPIDPREAVLRRRILDDGHLPYVWVELDPAWRLSKDPHPDARGARAIADAVTARLKAS